MDKKIGPVDVQDLYLFKAACHHLKCLYGLRCKREVEVKVQFTELGLAGRFGLRFLVRNYLFDLIQPEIS